MYESCQVYSGVWRPLLHHLRGSARLRAVAEQAGRHQSEGIVVIALFQIYNTFPPTITYQDTDKQVKDTPFPSITICTEGINMDAIMESVTRDFNDWLKMKKNVTTGDDSYTKEKHDDNVKEFFSDLFNISPSYNISLGDIALAYTSPDPDRYVM